MLFGMVASTSFGPAIRRATKIASENPNQQHVLLILSHQPVSRSRFTEHGKLSPQEQDTIDAIADAQNYPLSIIIAGVGKNSGDVMGGLTNYRTFSNTQFVDFTSMSSVPTPRREIEFALAATKTLRSQRKVIPNGKIPEDVPIMQALSTAQDHLQ
ncbi:E3 ubiquitin-protein ligase RGLG1-like [Papaver somniferum]|uniref:E3 ubiquitin-protein ligase RGLG1-like n=1 Tax=Papaver somniferum TaxID=3469 RepID=UPI000E702C08|nr:E3 ubiquitin-protein ligase RGLG1-like [Papaver somniferum]